MPFVLPLLCHSRLNCHWIWVWVLNLSSLCETRRTFPFDRNPDFFRVNLLVCFWLFFSFCFLHCNFYFSVLLAHWRTLCQRVSLSFRDTTLKLSCISIAPFSLMISQSLNRCANALLWTSFLFTPTFLSIRKAFSARDRSWWCSVVTGRSIFFIRFGWAVARSLSAY